MIEGNKWTKDGKDDGKDRMFHIQYFIQFNAT